jgi:hypothetical protein
LNNVKCGSLLRLKNKLELQKDLMQVKLKHAMFVQPSCK